MTAMMARSMSKMRTRYFLSLALALTSLTVTLPAYAQQATEQIMRTITVTGQGSEDIPTTITQVQLGVEVQGRTAEEVQQEAARRSSAVVQLLRSRNVQKLQTTGINLSPVYSYENNRQRLTGYTATNTVSFEIATEQAGTILDDAVNAGASRIDGVSFVASDEAIATARQQALREATQEARQQAQAVLESLNLREQEIVGIQVNGASAPPPPPVPYAALAQRAEAADATTPVVGGEQEVQASVTLQIRY
ncbi:MAG: SIMPL domain-containing protein [Microcoleus sp. SIO2G3]|nr:SIMPL domain-containing protein [Microcoleus sp. SIO2G3]